MKDYKRLTGRNEDGTTYVKCADCYIQDKCDLTKEVCCEELQDRLADLEDKIDSGELCKREEVKKETAKEIFNKLKKRKSLNYEEKTGLSWECVAFNDIIKIIKKYGVDLEEQK